MTIGSADFYGQADRLHAIQWALFLLHQGVPKTFLYVYIPQVEGVTVDTPRAHVATPPLVIPEEIKSCFSFEPYDVQHRFAFDFGNCRRGTDADRIVWIYLNHGADTGLSFPVGPSEHVDLSPGVFAQMFTPPVPRPPKLVLAVIDACYSKRFVGDARNLILDPVMFLVSGWAECFSSVPVISDDPRTNLPLIPPDILKGENIPFQHPMLAMKRCHRPYQPPAVVIP
jgi:hypothetical protein